MKTYRKKFDDRRFQAADANAPIYFAYEAQNDPAVGTTVTLVYDRNGEYLGFANPLVIRKYLYGQLYYKTKRAYCIKKCGYGRKSPKAVMHKASNRVSLYLNEVKITAQDLIDLDAPGAKAKLQRVRFERENLSPYNLSQGVHDPHGYLTSINDEMRTEVQALLAKYRNRIIETLTAIEQSESDMIDVGSLLLENENVA